MPAPRWLLALCAVARFGLVLICLIYSSATAKQLQQLLREHHGEARIL